MNLTRCEIYEICLNNNISFGKAKIKKNSEEIRNIFLKKFCKDSDLSIESKKLYKNIYYFISSITEKYEKEFAVWLSETVVFF